MSALRLQAFRLLVAAFGDLKVIDSLANGAQ
jgi:hypothetical protein